MALNITTAVIGSGCNAATASPSLAQWDKGQILQISGVELPETYKVEFSNGDTLEAIPAIGTAEGVEIPDKLLYSSSPIRAYIVLSEAEGERNTEYWVTIYVKPREIPEDIEPDPAQQDVIDDLIAQLNTGVEKAEDAADEAEAASQAVQDLGVRAETAASGAPAAVQKIVDAETGAVTLVFSLPQGEAGVSPVVTVTTITGGHRVTVTDADGAHTFDVMDGRSVTGVTMGADYKLTFTFSDGTTWTTPTSIRGETGATPRLTIGTVQTLEPGQSATAEITGTPEDPVLNLGIPKGQAGASDAGGVTYDPTETYQSGTAGAALNDLSRQISELGTSLEVEHGANFVDLDKSSGGMLKSDGTLNTDSAYKTTDFIDVSDYIGKTLYIGYRSNAGGVTATTVPVYCTYNSNKALIAYDNSWKNNIPIESGVKYIRFTRNASYFDKTSTNRIGAFINALPASFVDYEEHSAVVQSIDVLENEVGNIAGTTVIKHTEEFSASGTKTYKFDTVIPEGTVILLANTCSVKATNHNFNAYLMKKDGTTVNYGTTYSGTVLKIITEFDVYGISTWVNGKEWSFEIICGFNLEARTENVESEIKSIVKNDLTTGSFTNLTPTTDSLRLRPIDGAIQIKAGTAIVYDTDDLYIFCGLYDSAINPSLIDTIPWTTGAGTYIFKSAGYLIITLANAPDVSSSTWIVPEDYTGTIKIIGSFATLYESIEDSYNSAYHTFNNWNASAAAYSDLHGDSAETESFLFFTDPHLCEGNSWQSQFKEMMGQIQQCYNNVPTSFCLDGGDWLGNSDTVESARNKLGIVNGTMKSLFNRHYDLVGNHDTNEQGVTKLSNNCIRNLWYRDFENCYYTFNGQSTKFYCFNTEGEQDTLATNDNYGWTMCKWFANSLTTDNSKHIALAMHIVYVTPEFTTVNSISQKILDIAEAYNGRDSIEVNGESYSFANATGKIEFVIAGHSHADYDTTINGIPVILTENVRKAPASGATFDLVYVDYDNFVIKFVRVGHGQNRTIALAD